MHPLLQRQIRRHLGNLAELPPAWEKFLAQVDEAYVNADEDRTRLERTLELSSSELNERNLSLRHQVKERERAEELLRVGNARLTVWVSRLEQHNRQMALLNKMGDMLLTCVDVIEIYAVISDSLRLLFAGDPGSVAVLNDKKSCYEVVAEWPENSAGHRNFNADDCWALRRARQHVATPGSGEVSACAHLAATPPGGYICMPLVAQGTTVGLLTLQQGTLPIGNDGMTDDERLALEDARRLLVQTASEHIGLAIVNLRLRESLRLQSLRDPLTGLFNRRHMEAFLDREFSRARRYKHPVGMMMVDVDHFKRFNDDHGHQAGDALLVELARHLQLHVRGEDVACRYGGEEFILILPGATLETVVKRAERLRLAIADTMQVPYEGSTLPPVTLSIGVSSYPEHGDDPESCVRAADEALYQAKHSGRNRVERAG